MDINCSGYTGLQPCAAAHFFAQSQAEPGHNQNNCSGLPGRYPGSAQVNRDRGSGFGLRASGLAAAASYWISFLSRAHTRPPDQ